MVLTKSKKKILGVWDLRDLPVSLGGVLYFIEELYMQRAIHKADGIDMVVIGEWKQGKFQEHPLFSVLTGMEYIEDCHWMKSTETLTDLVKGSSYIVWPSQSSPRLNPGTTLPAQEFFREHGFIPYLSCKKEICERAKQYIVSKNAKRSVIVHMKNDPSVKGCSNARQEIWFEFFKIGGATGAKFIIIGDDEISPDILALPFIFRSRNDERDLLDDLALIQQGDLFMGMSSGPCNMAILNPKPYVIFKNPDHDVREMQKELGAADHFPFSVKKQKFIREFETPEKLMGFFSGFFS